MQESRRTTIDAVARAAGVSAKTASLALRGDRTVSNATTRKVRAAADRLNYDRLGRTLPIIGVVTPLMNHPFYAEFHQLMEDLAARSGYALRIEPTGERRDEQTVIDDLDRGRAEGVVLLSPRILEVELAPLLRTHRPMVAINSTMRARPGLSTVNFDQAHGERQALDLLLAQGHKRIAYLAGPSSSLSNRVRQATYESTLRKAGCFDYRLIIEISGSAPASYDFGYAACKRLLELRDFPEAILAFNDLVAIGAIRQIEDSQLRVPDDVSVIGFDDLDISRFTSPRLSTIQVHRRAAATEAIRILIALMNDPDETPEEVTLPTEFIRRESTPQISVRASPAVGGTKLSR